MEQLINEFKERLKSTGTISEKSLGVYIRGLKKVFNFYRKYNMVKTPDELFTCIMVDPDYRALSRSMQSVITKHVMPFVIENWDTIKKDLFREWETEVICRGPCIVEIETENGIKAYIGYEVIGSDNFVHILGHPLRRNGMSQAVSARIIIPRHRIVAVHLLSADINIDDYIEFSEQKSM